MVQTCTEAKPVMADIPRPTPLLARQRLIVHIRRQIPRNRLLRVNQERIVIIVVVTIVGAATIAAATR